MTDPAATQVLGKDREPCRECGAPLVADQRYCLNCGRRRGEPRIDFRQYEAPAVQPPAAAPAAAPSEEKPARDYTPLAAVGGIAVLGIMLLIGVLIGKGDSAGTATTPAPIVVRGGEADTGKAASEEGEGGAAKGGSKEAKPKAGSKGDGVVKGGSTGTGNAPVASDEQLQQLQEQSPQEYSENSAKLPDEIATGGAPPPEDKKAPGGGSKGTAIE
jgi:hypothetical protein